MGDVLGFNDDPAFRMQADDLGTVHSLPHDLEITPDGRGEAEIDVEFWEEHPDMPTQHKSYLVHELGARPIRELIEEAVQRHPASQPRRLHRF